MTPTRSPVAPGSPTSDGWSVDVRRPPTSPDWRTCGRCAASGCSTDTTRRRPRVGLVLPAVIAAQWGDPWGGLLVAGFLRAAVLLQATFCVNSLAHLVGTRRYDTGSSARDSVLTALITFGEGYHSSITDSPSTTATVLAGGTTTRANGCLDAQDEPSSESWSRTREDRRVIFEPGLIRRIESSSGRVTMATAAAFVARAAASRAHAVAFAGGTLAAFGAGRYVNRAVGVSLNDLADDQLDELESFFTAAGVPSSLEVASSAPATLLARLATRGYTVSWFRNVYVAALDDRPQPLHPAMTVDEVTDDTVEEWLAVLRVGNKMTTPDAAAISDEWARASRGVAGTTVYLAYPERNGCRLRINHPRVRHRLDRRGHDGAGLSAPRRAGRARPATHDGGVRVGMRSGGSHRSPLRRLGP